MLVASGFFENGVLKTDKIARNSSGDGTKLEMLKLVLFQMS
jgi:hypothetical protein